MSSRTHTHTPIPNQAKVVSEQPTLEIKEAGDWPGGLAKTLFMGKKFLEESRLRERHHRRGGEVPLLRTLQKEQTVALRS